jgi:hypothetical protein
MKLKIGGQCPSYKISPVKQAFQPVPHRRDACATRAFSQLKAKTQNLKPTPSSLPVGPQVSPNHLRVLLNDESVMIFL